MAEGNHAVNWFEIPVTEMSRAVKFYQAVLAIEMPVEEYGPTQMAIFPVLGEPTGMTVHGALVKGEGYTPGPQGARLYLAAGPDLSVALSRVEAAGGTILQPKSSIGDHGFMAVFKDTEGNVLALHSMS